MQVVRRLMSIALGLSLATFSVAGCSSASSGSSAAATGPIKIGQIVALSGALTFPDIAGAAEGGVLGLNARGGIDGHRVVLITCDEANNPNNAAACAHRLVADGVVAEVGGQSITGEQEVGSILNAAGIPQIGDESTGGMWKSLPSEFFTFETVTTVQAVGALKECAILGLKRVASPALPVPSAAAINQVVSQVAGKLGVGIAASPQVPLTETDYAPVTESLASAGVQCIDPEIPPQGITGLLKADQSLGKKFQLILNSGILRPADIASLGGLANGMIVVSSYPVPTDTAEYPVFKQFQSDMKLAASQGAPYDQPNASSAAINAWFAVQAFSKVMTTVLQAGEKPTASALMAALRKAKNVNLGLPTLWNPNSPGPSWGTRVWNGVVYPEVVRNGVESDVGQPFNVLSLTE